MKRTRQILLLCSCMLLSISCKKDKQTADTELTGCPVNTTCQYSFTEAADISANPGFFMKPGNYRLFWSTIRSSGMTASLYMLAPMKGTGFMLGKADMLAGRVIYVQSCPSCMLIPMKAADGYVQGKLRNPGQRADQTQWLLEARVILQAVHQPSLKDTVFIRQYFSPNFIID